MLLVDPLDLVQHEGVRAGHLLRLDIPVSLTKENTSPKKNTIRNAYMFSEHQIRGWIAVLLKIARQGLNQKECFVHRHR